MRRLQKMVYLLFLTVVSILAAVFLSNIFIEPKAIATAALLQPAPTQPLGYYDYFGKLLSPQQASDLVSQQGLDPKEPDSYARVGAVLVTKELLKTGEAIFINRKIGDNFGLQRIFGFGLGLTNIAPELGKAISDLRGQPTSNLFIILQKDLTLGSRTFPQGSIFPRTYALTEEQSSGLNIS